MDGEKLAAKCETNIEQTTMPEEEAMENYYHKN